ncbi:MAG: DinB family protein, partial [Pyrinomonadaceae bacterium]
IAVTLSLFAAAAPSSGADTITQKERDYAVKYLEETREKFLAAVAGLSEAQWKFKSAPDRWSVAEVAEHIALSEGLILQLVTDRVMKSPPAKPPAGSVTDESVVKLVLDRTGKAQAPEMLKPTGKWATREELTKDFIAGREKTIAYVKGTQDDLRAHSAPHPVLKALDAYQWVLLLAAHSARHTAQIEEVKADPDFPKR